MALKSELTMVSKERDDLRDRLKEFEIIADDLANLKRLQQENEQLKRSLQAQGHSVPVMQEEPKKILDQADVSDLFEDLGQSDSNNDNSALEDFLSSPSEETESSANSDEDSSSALEDAMLATDEEAPTEENKN